LRKALLFGLTAAALLVSATPAAASPVATSDETYSVLGRVFPDPLAGCSGPVCSPNAQGTFPATQFIQYQEFVDALGYMNQRSEWSRYMEVLPLDDGQFPGNNLPLEFDPKPEYQSAGLPTSDLGRKKSDIYVVRVTDETVPDAGKKRYALSLSIHGIERAGAEGGTRAMEDLVTAATTGRDDDTIVPTDVDENAPTFADVLRKSIIYFTYPNPDGWRRGSVTEGGLFFQRYNGNGMDVNRDWPDIGFSYRPYSGLSEPETRALAGFFQGVRSNGGEFAAGDDLHGMPFADALSYTLLPHGRHDYAKDQRIRDAAIRIHQNSEQALSWSPIIQPNDAPKGGGIPCSPDLLGEACAQIYGQTWGTVYDTIDYTTTGTLGDWFDSKAGLNADGIDNEMAFSHLDRNIVFDPHGEQLHVDGNKALIYAHLSNILDPPANQTFDAAGAKGYVPNTRLTRTEQVNQPDDSGQDPQGPIDMGPKAPEAPAAPDPENPEGIGVRTIYDADDGLTVNPGNGGMRVEVTQANVQGISPSFIPIANQVTLKVECMCTDHHGPADSHEPEWTVASEDFNQQQLYMAAGLTASVNRPEGGVPWRLVIEGLHLGSTAHVEFTRGPASTDGNTGGDEPPRLAAYDVANTDFLRDLDPYSRPGEGFDPIQPRQVLGGGQSLDSLDSLVLADDALPGYTGKFGGAVTGDPSPSFEIASETPTVPGANQPDAQQIAGCSARVPGTYEAREWDVAPEARNASMTVDVDWADSANDFDMALCRVEDGAETQVGSSTGVGGSGSSEQIVVSSPAAGHYKLYVDNWASTDPAWTGAVTFTGFTNDPDTGPTGDFTAAEKDAWMAELRRFVREGGNLVLTDGALRALPDLVDGINRAQISEHNQYVGQISFADGDGNTLEDPLARDIEQPGARFKSGDRRQTFEPTPLGFAIQDPDGAETSSSPIFDVDRAAWEAAGGRYVAGSTTSGGAAAQPLTDRVAVGEITLGEGRIRIAGSMLPQPSTEFDHPLGIEPYSATYTSYILARNLFDWEDPTPESAGGPKPPGGGPAAKPPAAKPKPKAKAKKKKRKCKPKRGKKRKGCKKR
jgi:hypothetical protein